MADFIIRNEPLANPWPGTDPFLFCARHLDHFPSSDGAQGVPEAKIGNRPLGNDFTREGGFSLYYGTRVPGFPVHPHRGFETVTIVPAGLVDHSDSLGATARYGDGDVQWLTAGKGVLHAEMFPLRDAHADNILDLYQIWLNLPAADKMVPPAFVMLWGESIPVYEVRASNGAVASVQVIAGPYAPQEKEGAAVITPLAPAPDSYASKPEADLAIWLIRIEAGAQVTLPPAQDSRTRRTLYFDRGETLVVAGQTVAAARLLEVRAQVPLTLSNPSSQTAHILLLQAVPIGEPVVAQGPFVMNTQAEIDQTKRDFARTHFGGWPWPEAGPVHPVGQGRFALYPGAQAPDLPPPRG